MTGERTAHLIDKLCEMRTVAEHFDAALHASDEDFAAPYAGYAERMQRLIGELFAIAKCL